MSPLNTAVRALLNTQQAASEIRLPRGDVRKTLDESVFRGWTEHTRRAVRVVCLLLADTLAGLAGVVTVLHTWWLVSNDGLRPVPNAIPLIAMVCCIQPLALRVTGTYGGGRARVSIGRILAATLMAAVIGWIQARLFGAMSPTLPNKTAYLYSAEVIALFVWLERTVFDRAIKFGFRKGLMQRRILLIAHRADLELVQRRIDRTAVSDVRVVAALSPAQLPDSLEPLDRAIKASSAQAVAVASNLPSGMLNRLIDRCFANGIGISLLPSGVQDQGAFFELYSSNIGLMLGVFPLRFGLPQLAIKRTMDVVFTVCGLLIIWPLLLLIALLVKLDSRGPVFFRQSRLGVGGRQFEIYKFRSMTADAEARKASLQHLNEYGNGKLFKITNDPRITKIGRFLRKTSLDELPQLWNVLKGDMSLVGPRPCVPAEFAHYEPHHFVRLVVVPGVTGPWQVNGRNEVTDFEEVVRLESDYIRNWSVWSDIAILCRTIPVLLSGHGAR